MSDAGAMFPAILVRLIALVLLDVAALGAASQIEGDAGVAIGVGLLLFGAYALISLLWGLSDGRRRGIVPALLIWAAVSVGVGVAMPLVTALAPDGGSATDWSVVGDDVLFNVPFVLSIVLAPAAIGAAIGAATRRNTQVPVDSAR